MWGRNTHPSGGALGQEGAVQSAKEGPIQVPIPVTHECLIHNEESKFDLTWKGILPPRV